MERRRKSFRALRWWFITVLLATGCEHATMPRLIDPQPAVPPLPIAIALNFDEPLRAATLQHTMCADTPWEGQLGKSIVETFERKARKRYARVLIGPVTEADSPPNIAVDIRLVDKSFEAKTRTGANEEYTARLMIALAASFKDAKGRLLTEGPLTYKEDFRVYTPQEGSSTQCRTESLDVALDDAGRALADQMDVIVAGIAKVTGTMPQAVGQTASPQGTSALVLRATLEDGNKNQLLEPGEKVTLRLNATNEGRAPVGSASISLSGSPSIVEAFSTALAGAPLLVGTVPPGETRATLIAGTMPANIQEERIELTLSAVTGEGLSVNPVMLVAAAKTTHPVVRADNRYAVIVGLSHYRTPWRGVTGIHASEIKRLVGLFRDSLGVPDAHILLLQDELAGQAELEEALVRWLPQRVSADSIVFFYFVGQSVSDAGTGEVFLLPHDGTPSSSRARWLSLRVLQQRLKSLGARLSVAVLEAPVTSVKGAVAKKGAAKRPKPANWAGNLRNNTASKDGAGLVIQVVPRSSRNGRLSQTLDLLTGNADANHDGRVTLSEWLRSVRGIASTYPTLPPPPAILAIPLSTQRK